MRVFRDERWSDEASRERADEAARALRQEDREIARWTRTMRTRELARSAPRLLVVLLCVGVLVGVVVQSIRLRLLEVQHARRGIERHAWYLSDRGMHRAPPIVSEPVDEP